jgi:transketolase
MIVDEILDYPREIFSDTILELGRRNKDIIFISCDTSLGTGAKQFRELYPDRHLEFGIQEQNAITAAAGLAHSGKIPLIGAHVPFIILKCVEQIKNDLCKTNLNVNILGRDFGLQPSSLGATHMVLEDIGIMRTIPNIKIIAPADGPEYREALLTAVEIEGPVYIRLSRQPTRRINNQDYKFTFGKAVLLKEGSDLTLISTSTLVSNMLEAAVKLKDRGINAEVLNIHTLKPIDEESILESSLKTKKVITIEEHSIINGLGSAVSDILIEKNPVKMKMIGTNDCFPITAGSYNKLLDYYGFTVEKLVKRIENFYNNFF